MKRRKTHTCLDCGARMTRRAFRRAVSAGTGCRLCGGTNLQHRAMAALGSLYDDGLRLRDVAGWESRPRLAWRIA